MEVAGEHRDDPRLVLDRRVFDGHRSVDWRLGADAGPELVLRHLEVMPEDAAETAGADRLPPGVRDVRLQNPAVVEKLLVEDVPRAATAVAR